MIQKLVKISIVANYLWFIAGIQIAAGVNLFINAYFIDLLFQKFLIIVVAGLVLGLGGFLSLILGAEIESIVKITQLYKGTPLEKDSDQHMDNELGKNVHVFNRYPLKRITKIRILLYSDTLLSIIGIALIVISKPRLPLS